MMLGRQPGPAPQLRGGTEPADVADLGEEHRRQDRPDAGQLLQRDVAGIGDQPAPGEAGEQIDLLIKVIDEPQQRLHPRRIRAGQ
jgi:hypothetical protein